MLYHGKGLTDRDIVIFKVKQAVVLVDFLAKFTLRVERQVVVNL